MVEWQKPGGVAGIRFLPPLKTLAEFPQWVQRYPSPQDSDSAPPLSACRSESNASEFDTALRLFASSAMMLTGASGAAIALGNSSGMECRASVGVAPEVGAPLRPDSGISGHSLRTAAVILCHDLWSDSRADVPAARQMDMRSIVIVPIVTAGEIVGILEVFSRDTNRFEERHVQQLQPLVNVLAEAIQEETAGDTRDETGKSASPAANALEFAKDSAKETSEAEQSAPQGLAAYQQYTDRFRAPAIVIAVLAALLILIGAASWFNSRYRSGSSGGSNSQSGRQGSASAGATGAVSAAKAVIGFSPAIVNRNLGATFGVDVVIRGARDLSSVPLQILYNPQKLQVVKVTSGGLLDRDGQATALVRRVDASAGRLDISVSRPSSVPGISGDGVVFTLVFLSRAPGRSQLRIDQSGLRDASAKPVPVEGSEATVNISSSITPALRNGAAKALTPTPPPAAMSGNSATNPSVQAGRAVKR